MISLAPGTKVYLASKPVSMRLGFDGLAALEAERAAHDATREKLQTAQNSIKLTALQIEKLKVQLARLRRMKSVSRQNALPFRPTSSS